MLDYTKITFTELEDPLQVFYNYDLGQHEIDDFLRKYATVDEVPEGVSIQKIELCLTLYARHGFKMEARCIDTENNQYWVKLPTQFVDEENVDKLVDLIPDKSE